MKGRLALAQSQSAPAMGLLEACLFSRRHFNLSAFLAVFCWLPECEEFRGRNQSEPVLILADFSNGFLACIKIWADRSILLGTQAPFPGGVTWTDGQQPGSAGEGVGSPLRKRSRVFLNLVSAPPHFEAYGFLSPAWGDAKGLQGKRGPGGFSVLL